MLGEGEWWAPFNQSQYVDGAYLLDSSSLEISAMERELHGVKRGSGCGRFKLPVKNLHALCFKEVEKVLWEGLGLHRKD